MPAAWSRRSLLELMVSAMAAAAGGSGAALAAAVVDDDRDPLLEHALRRWRGDLDGMLKRGMIRVATVGSLSTFFYDKAQERGVTYELTQAFEAQLHKAYGRKASRLRVVILPTTRDRLLPYVVQGKADIAAANLTVTPGRKAQVDFSRPFMTEVREIVVTGPAARGVRGLEDLVRTPVFARRSSSYYEHLTRLNASRKAKGKHPIAVRRLDEGLESQDFLQMVSVGMLPAVVVDEPVAEFWTRVYRGLELHQDIVIHKGGDIAWAFRKKSPRLTKAVNGFVVKAAKGTTLGNVILNRYLQSVDWAKDALAPGDEGRFEKVAGYLKTYAKQYDFDWLMIGAQAYQESRFDQKKVSPAGAIGIMQLMPATAAEVGIPNIRTAENNIHAGVKYLRYLRDTYYSDPKLSSLDQTLFSFAAYNAGPRSVTRSRTRAGSMGLDADVWLGNVEIAAGRTVSQEPVTYVRNIYKYYVAYKLLVSGKAYGGLSRG
jgi:membrane-bound lytic murein transglycosylase MltF